LEDDVDATFADATKRVSRVLAATERNHTKKNLQSHQNRVPY
jgi:hypothetical protein